MSVLMIMVVAITLVQTLQDHITALVIMDISY